MTKYLGSCYESFQYADGTVCMTKLYVSLVRGERRFFLTEQDARRAVER